MEAVMATDAGQKHPRVCGEDKSLHEKYLHGEETPPRMRGRLIQPCGLNNLAGNTPAYAGKTLLTVIEAAKEEKHPRVCGEDLRLSTWMTPGLETPPRMRGRPASAQTPAGESRNTPAYAGKTVPRFRGLR